MKISDINVNEVAAVNVVTSCRLLLTSRKKQTNGDTFLNYHAGIIAVNLAALRHSQQGSQSLLQEIEYACTGLVAAAKAGNLPTMRARHAFILTALNRLPNVEVNNTAASRPAPQA